jgi:hypothetical protein
MNYTICDSIEARRLIRFDYNGLSRTVEPHAHGFNSKRNEVVRGFQVARESRSDDAAGWRFFIVAEMSNLAVLAKTFRVERAGHNEAAQALIVVHCTAT